MKIFTKLDPSVSSLPQFGKETPYPPQKVHISHIYKFQEIYFVFNTVSLSISCLKHFLSKLRHEKIEAIESQHVKE